MMINNPHDQIMVYIIHINHQNIINIVNIQNNLFAIKIIEYKCLEKLNIITST